MEGTQKEKPPSRHASTPCWKIVARCWSPARWIAKHLRRADDRLVAPGLRPAVRIEIGVQTTPELAVDVGPAAEDGLGEGDLHVGVAPVPTPGIEEAKLPLPEQDRPRDVDAAGIVVGVGDVIRARTLFGYQPFGATLELPVLEDREADPPPPKLGVVDADAALDGSGIEGIGEVARLGPLHHLHVLDRAEVAAIGPVGIVGLLPPRAPEVGLAHVVVVGNGDRRAVPDDRAEVAAELEPRRVVAGVVVDLVPGEEQQIGVEGLDVVEDVLARDVPAVRGVDRVPGEAGDDDLVLVDGVLANPTVVESGGAVGHAVVPSSRVVPVLDPQRGGPSGLDHRSGPDLVPAVIALDLQAHLPLLALLQRIELRRHLEDAVVNRVEREADHLFARHLGNREDVQLLWRSLPLRIRPRQRRRRFLGRDRKRGKRDEERKQRESNHGRPRLGRSATLPRPVPSCSPPPRES